MKKVSLGLRNFMENRIEDSQITEINDYKYFFQHLKHIKNIFNH